MKDELFSHRLRRWRENKGYSQDDAGRLLGVTGRYVGMIERGEKEVEPHLALYKLFSLLEDNKVSATEFEPRSNYGPHLLNDDPAPYNAAPQRGTGILSMADVASQVRADLHVIENAATHAEKRRAFLFLRDFHLPAIAKLLNLQP